MKRVTYEEMVQELSRVLESRGFGPADARDAAVIFAQNSLAGVPGHGLNRFPRTVDYLDRVYKQNCGRTITGYLLEARMEKAKELLTETVLPISAVAARVGYVNFSLFSGSFRKYTGLTPQAYRNKNQQGKIPADLG